MKYFQLIDSDRSIIDRSIIDNHSCKSFILYFICYNCSTGVANKILELYHNEYRLIIAADRITDKIGDYFECG